MTSDKWQRRIFSIERLEHRRMLSVSEPSTLLRPADPVVMTAADVPATIGWDPHELVAFREVGAGWQPAEPDAFARHS